MRYRSIVKQKWRIFLTQPLQYLERHTRLRPGIDLAGMDDAAIAPTCLQPGPRLAVDHLDLVAGPGEVPSGCNAYHAGTQHDRCHLCAPGSLLFARVIQTGKVTSSKGGIAIGAAICYAAVGREL
jgi:hypothetical protein